MGDMAEPLQPKADRFLEGFEDCEILRPSKAYQQACASYPYRISELVFGSLLASYILGFINVAGASATGADAPKGMALVAVVLTYLTISFSFSLLTAAFY